MTFLPRAGVKSVDSIESVNGKHAVIEVSIEGAHVRSRMSWVVFAGLRPYALRWIQTLNQGAGSIGTDEPEASEPAKAHDQETRSNPGACVTVDTYDVE
jgi:hypothetical protein